MQVKCENDWQTSSVRRYATAPLPNCMAVFFVCYLSLRLYNIRRKVVECIKAAYTYDCKLVEWDMNQKWYFDEAQHAGVDYGNTGTARAYDEQHETFRNYEDEARQIAEVLELRRASVVLDIGCGTGGITLHVASYCSKVIAVDISQPMLDILNEKAYMRHIGNIETHCAGFLTYEHASEPVDCIITKAALHHLPDFWKLIALQRIRTLLLRVNSTCLMSVFPFIRRTTGHASSNGLTTYGQWRQRRWPMKRLSILKTNTVHSTGYWKE